MSNAANPIRVTPTSDIRLAYGANDTTTTSEHEEMQVQAATLTLLEVLKADAKASNPLNDLAALTAIHTGGVLTAEDVEDMEWPEEVQFVEAGTAEAKALIPDHPPEISEIDLALTEELVAEVTGKVTDAEKYSTAKVAGKTPKKQPGTAIDFYTQAAGARLFLREYGSRTALDIAMLRSALTNKLIEIANCGEVKHELRAIELLGKQSDVALFSEHTVMDINFSSDPDKLESEIKKRIGRLLHAQGTDYGKFGMDLDKELAMTPVDDPEEAEFTEVEGGDNADEGDGDDGIGDVGT